MPARPPQGKVILYTTSTPSTRFQKTAIRNVTALLAAKNVAYEEARAPSRAHMVACDLPAPLARAPCAAWRRCSLPSPQVDLAEEPARRSAMLKDSGGKSALPQLHVNGKVTPVLWPCLRVRTWTFPESDEGVRPARRPCLRTQAELPCLSTPLPCLSWLPASHLVTALRSCASQDSLACSFTVPCGAAHPAAGW
jgi:hypothetical protein